MFKLCWLTEGPDFQVMSLVISLHYLIFSQNVELGNRFLITEKQIQQITTFGQAKIGNDIE